MKKILIFAFAMAAAMSSSHAVVDNGCPVSENVRGHENIEWSISYAYHFTDKMKELPRVLLVGDSICNGYQGKVRDMLEGKVNVTYWVSSYCVTSPGYLRLLGFYLDEAKYDVIHFNNGLHSLNSPTGEYEKAYRDALSLVKRKQPGAKIVWVSSTPLNTSDPAAAAKVCAVNEAAERAAKSVGVIVGNDLFSLMNPLDRGKFWVDSCHYNHAGYGMLAAQVVEKVVAEL